MIFYFSGTGNTKFVADMLADLLQDTAQNIMELEGIKVGPGRRDYDFSAVKVDSERPYIVLSPVYVASPARMVTCFVSQAQFGGSRDIYFLMTCAGGMASAYEYFLAALKGKNMNYMGTRAFVMPQNYILYFPTEDRETGEERIRVAIPQIEETAQLIQKGQKIAEQKENRLKKLGTNLILRPYERFFMTTGKFYSTDACIGCGKCERVCPLQNVKLAEANDNTATGETKNSHKSPAWGKNCTHCMACINYCPMKAIEYGNKTQGKVRYTCRTYQNR